MERKLIAAAISSALTLPMAAQAVEFAVSGQVNRAIMTVDGTGMPNEGDVQNVDANVSETRIKFVGSEELENGNTVGVNLEYASGKTSGSYAADEESGLRVRHQNVYMSGAWGKLTIGQTQSTSDQAPFANLGGLSGLGGATVWCAHASNSSVACGTFSEGRKELLRYDSPAIGPVSIAATTGNDGYWDAMVKIAGSVGDAGYDIRVAHVAEFETDVDATPASVTAVRAGDLTTTLAAAEETVEVHFMDPGFTLQDAEGTAQSNADLLDTPANAVLYKHQAANGPSQMKNGDTVIASASVAFGQGTSATVAWADQDTTQQNYQYVALDHSYGDGSVGVYFKQGEDGVENIDSSNWGVGIGHDIGGGANVYAGFRNMEQDGMEDVDLLVAGMRVTFN